MSVYLPGYFGGYSDESNSFVLTAYNGGVGEGGKIALKIV